MIRKKSQTSFSRFRIRTLFSFWEFLESQNCLKRTLATAFLKLAPRNFYKYVRHISITFLAVYSDFGLLWLLIQIFATGFMSCLIWVIVRKFVTIQIISVFLLLSVYEKLVLKRWRKSLGTQIPDTTVTEAVWCILAHLHWMAQDSCGRSWV